MLLKCVLPTDKFGSTEVCVLVTIGFDFECRKNFSDVCKHLTCMFVGSIDTMSIRKNNRKGHTTLQSDSMIVNVRT